MAEAVEAEMLRVEEEAIQNCRFHFPATELTHFNNAATISHLRMGTKDHRFGSKLEGNPHILA